LRGLFLEGAYYRKETYVSKLAGLIIGGTFVSIFECATGNIRGLGSKFVTIQSGQTANDSSC